MPLSCQQQQLLLLKHAHEQLVNGVAPDRQRDGGMERERDKERQTDRDRQTDRERGPELELENFNTQG